MKRGEKYQVTGVCLLQGREAKRWEDPSGFEFSLAVSIIGLSLLGPASALETNFPRKSSYSKTRANALKPFSFFLISGLIRKSVGCQLQRRKVLITHSKHLSNSKFNFSSFLSEKPA